jgi:uncharacterized protein YbaP (TraB family)
MMTEKAKYPLLWAYLCLLLAGDGLAANSIPNGDALLWKVTTKSDKTSHVFGTIHSDDKRVLQLKPGVQAAFAGSERLLLEIALTPEGVLDMMARMYRRDNSGLKQELPAPLYAQTVEAFHARGLEDEWVNRLTIWGAALTLMIPQSSGLVLDLQLQTGMQARGKPVLGLETVESQLAVFADLDQASQIKLLSISLEELKRLEETTEKLIQYYLREDIAGIAGMEQEFHTGENRVFMERLMNRLIDDRNQRMVKAMEEHLQTGQTFVAVGALHLPGKHGIINLLRKAGYKVEAVR